ncbi:MAG: phage tail protein [Thermoanaerobaculia bacterium]|nr:phage tail protein [Thermoanaerobaculia bacterium]
MLELNTDYYPPGAFYFGVYLIGAGALTYLLPTSVDASFQEVSGLEVKFDTEDVVEGGENRFVHHLPRPARYSNLVLKRGVVTTDSLLGEWVGLTIGSTLSLPIVTQNLLVVLYSESGLPSIAWGVVNAYPLRWQTDTLSSLDNKVLTETLEFSYNYFERFTFGSGLSAVATAAKLAQVAARYAT